MLKKTLISTSLVLYASMVYGAQVKEVMPDGETQAFIALDELSRIKVINDRIKSVKSNEGEIEVLEDANLGEIYIRPTRNSQAPVNMFITTERNNTYKLLLLPHKAPSTQVFIKGLEDALDKNTNQKVRLRISESFKEKVLALIQAMETGKAIAGFKETSPGNSTNASEEKSIELAGNDFPVISTYKGVTIKAQVIEVDEDFDAEKALSQKSNIIAASMDENVKDGRKRLYLIMEAGNERA